MIGRKHERYVNEYNYEFISNNGKIHEKNL
jgi:hypothetical protein